MHQNNPDSINHIKPTQLDKSPFMVAVFLRHPHTQSMSGMGFDTEILVPSALCWAHSAKEMIQIARDTLIPAQYDPALISVVVDPLCGYDSKVEA